MKKSKTIVACFAILGLTLLIALNFWAGAGNSLVRNLCVLAERYYLDTGRWPIDQTELLSTSNHGLNNFVREQIAENSAKVSLKQSEGGKEVTITIYLEKWLKTRSVVVSIPKPISSI